ncbi:Glycoside hydrolase family 2 [Pleurostoma richardsiae]|uniref:Glycoside hydrolase family 2 n=1 Tax=Pleurostoma richardsiae TaxID=41990 RepID=A0AA38R6A9_9PEZI|nr:Glycoside hydrolase family 2 [Pleurostoma richardsiae]
MDYLARVKMAALSLGSRISSDDTRPHSMPREDTSNGDDRPANPLTYPKSAGPFDPDLFRNPTSEYRGCPFSAWNTRLERNLLKRQIDHLAEMGMGGFHMHVRTGLDTEYLGNEFMDAVRDCVDYAESKGMLACLYDDDRWPSGSAGGKVTKQFPEYKGQHILFTKRPYGTAGPVGGCSPSTARACRSENGHLLAMYAVTLDEDGCLKEYRRLKPPVLPQKGAAVWIAYLESNPPSPWFNDQTYVDTLSKEAMAHFIETTHEVYKDKIGDKFGTTVPCIFTDEPQFATKTQLSNPRATEDVFLPWTSDLAESFRREYGAGADLIEKLPELIWDLPNGKPSLTRYRFHDHVCERFVSAFMDQLAAWCKANSIFLDGHMMEEPTLRSQTTALGEAMRCYRSQDLPGIDLLNDGFEYNTAKQASSVARQNGVRGCMSEIYGCTHWYFTFEGHKGCGDWQAALGITFRVHHLAWLSMAGEAKRDYPASISYQSPWYKEYSYIEDHFARVGVAMTRGRAVTRVAVIHPIESFWLSFGPNGAGDEMQRRDQDFADLTSWLLHGLLDFDFISESLLPDQFGGVSGKKLRVGKCRYEVVILPNLLTIRSTTVKILSRFMELGGSVIVAGSAPKLVDAQEAPTYALENLNASSTRIPWNKIDVLASLETYRDLKIVKDDPRPLPDPPSPVPTETLLYQMRQDGEDRFVFICNTDRDNSYRTFIDLKGSYTPFVLDTFTGTEDQVVSAMTSSGRTTFYYMFEGCGSLLLRLQPLASSSDDLPASLPQISEDRARQTGHVELVGVDLSEPNVLMLDYATYKVDDGPWSETKEILQVDNAIRDILKMPRKGSAWRQPWTVTGPERQPRAKVTLAFDFHSDADISEPTQLALEDVDAVVISVNGTQISGQNDEASWWVDEAIRTVPVAEDTIRKGPNCITLEVAFGILTNLERIYLLGSFDVRFRDNTPFLCAAVTPVPTWGDITTQGLPFYVGNVTYKCKFILESPAQAALSVPQFSSPVLRVDVVQADGKGEKRGNIATQPRTLNLGRLGACEHDIAITAFGNRFNAFGHVHLPDGVAGSCWPDIWRSRDWGEWAWTDGYNLKPIGILECPTILTEVTSEVDSGWVLVGHGESHDVSLR